MKTITTVEELGALPEGAVIAFEDIGTPNAAVLASTEDGPRWWTTVDAPSANGDGYPHESIWSFYGESGEPGITLVYPLVFDAADADRAAEALRDDKANRAEYYHVPEWADTPYGDKLVYRSAARAVLGAVGSVDNG